MKNKLRAAWIFPSSLYLHGERGNLLALKKIANLLDTELKVDQIELNNNFNPNDYDILYFSAGEIVHFKTLIKQLDRIKPELLNFVNSGKPLIVTGNTISLFGNKIYRTNGEIIKGLNFINLNSTENNQIYGDDIYFMTQYNGKDLEIIGNQIQMSDLNINNETPFGKLLYGYGNNGSDLNEGVIKNNSIFTNTLGPLLVLNPWLTLEIIKVALKNKGIQYEKKFLDFELEKKILESKKNYIKNKKSNLRNAIWR